MEERNYYYARVSSMDQNLERQRLSFEDDCQKRFGKTLEPWQLITDKKSGKNFEDRTGYMYLKTNLLRSGDTLTVMSLDRLSRDKEQMKTEIEELRKREVTLRVLDIPTTLIDFTKEQRWIQDMVTNILIEVLATMAEQERINIRKRQAQGIAAMPVDEDGKKYSMKTGRRTGRPQKATEEFEKIYNYWKNKEITATDAAKQLEISRVSFYRKVKAYEQRL